MSKTIWRLLEPLENLKRGDEFLTQDRVWLPCMGLLAGGMPQLTPNIYRRRETIPDSPAPSWVSVDLALPDKMGMVLALRKDRTADVAYVHEGTVSQYTHWMPLPALPEPEKDEDDEAFKRWVPNANDNRPYAKQAWDEALVYARGGKP